MHIYEVGDGHCLVVINLRYVDDPERIERAYLNLPADHPARPAVWQMLCVPDPLIDPVGYAEAHWWRDLTIVDMGLILRMEALGLMRPWPHSHTAGPILTPSR
ncbi:hypothetical protein ACOQFV_27510 [Nocardiopsis changdeensis]|uniref:Uncharacterized protein n=1 Tax=Nocardiopsis changdeensis TaxID=2831969 RepID=A0ABX8BLA7_9ACTN|nr:MULTISPECIES: hypothetical protein [Nocardiopsis]QUX23014.1 hypothetical protein KGD84_00965 [Nocardiopsis changdeensis]QYX38959.1 hypothetical protein K1J57_10420 [Nocardiopsis sp. MT53]